MQAVELREVKINPRLRAKLLQAQYLTAAEVLLSSPGTVARKAKLSLAEASLVLHELSVAVCARDSARDRSVADFVEREEQGGRKATMTTGDAGLDELLGGGLRVGSMTEVAGHSSSGKTHLCLQSSLTCQLPLARGGLAGGALFVSSEGTVSSTRLFGLAEHLVSTLPPDPFNPLTAWDFLDNVHAEKAPDVETLEAVLSYHAPAAIERINALAAAGRSAAPTISPFDDPLPSQFLSRHRQSPPRPPLSIRLIIVDSIAAPFRAETETGSTGFAVRAKDFAHLSDTLKRLAHVYNCAVLVINQVQDVFDSRGPLSPSFLEETSYLPTSAPFPPSFAVTLATPSPFPPRAAHLAPPPTPLSRTSTSSTLSSSSSSSNPLPAPHQHYAFPPLLYNRFQSPHFSGADASSPYRTASSPSFLLPFSPAAPVSAALGHSWSNIPNVRVLCLLKRSGAGAGGGGEGGEGGGKTRRAMSLVFSPYAPRAAVEYEIDEERGVRTVGEVNVRPVGRNPSFRSPVVTIAYCTSLSPVLLSPGSPGTPSASVPVEPASSRSSPTHSLIMVASSKAVILIGGPSKGTRFRPLSLDVPKPLFAVGGRSIIWHSLVALSRVEGLSEVLLIGFYDEAVISPFIKEATRDFPNISVKYLREYQSLGTAGGLYHYRDLILKGNPDQVFVLHSDVVSTWPLQELQKFHGSHRGVGTVMAVKVPKEESLKFGCIVVDPETSQAKHYVEKPEDFLSDTVNAGLYLFDSALLFSSIRDSMDNKLKTAAAEPEATNDDNVRLEQDVLAPLAEAGKLYVYQTSSPWTQIKTAASAIPANALILASYKTTNPTLLRRRSPTILAKSRADYSKSKGPEIVEPCFIDEQAVIDPSAKIGPNVSIGAGVKVGAGVRIKESIILDNVTLDKNACVLYSIVSEGSKIGPWARVEGAPLVGDKQSIAILGKDVSVLKEVHIRSCIVLPSKVLSKSAKNEVLL
ncbi:hypothetical protein JCM8547_005026 [Rhodosporidiobolus lusitaniae]